MLRKLLVHASVLLLTSVPVCAAVKLPTIFSDGAVLQRDMPVKVWGWAEPGEKVTVAIQGQTASAVATDGNWAVTLKPLSAGGPMDMTVSAGDSKTVVKDVLVGEVWVAAGQSNMMMSIASVTGGNDAMKALDPKAKIHLFAGGSDPALSTTPQRDLKGRWSFPQSGYSAVSTFFAMKLYDHLDRKVPVGIVFFCPIRPAESWCSESVIASSVKLKELKGRGYPHDTARAFNGMIAPLAPYALRGALYYQGEMNGGRGVQFRAIMPAVIRSWRDAWGRPDLPFLFVQLPGFQEHRAGKDTRMDMDAKSLAALHQEGEEHGFTEVREAQLMTWQSVPHTGMAVTIDVGEAWDIHPHDKEPVAARLLLQARKVAYGETLVASGPVPTKAEFRDGEVIVHFEDVGGGMVSKAKAGGIQGFDLAGSDRKFYPATARIAGDTVVVSCPQVKSAAMVHYAWAGYPLCTLSNKEGLPATPFRFFEPNRLPMAEGTSFPFRNGSFEQAGKEPNQPADWGSQGEAFRTADKASDGKFSAVLPGKHAGVTQNKIAVGLGYAWNSNPLKLNAVRPGCVAGYSVDIAGGPGEGPAIGYMRLCQNASAGGYQGWGGIPLISTAGEKSVRRHVAHRFSAEHVETGNEAGTLFANHDGKRPVYLDNLSAVTILRPLLAISDTTPIDLGTVAPGKTAESQPRQIANGQKQTVAQLLTDDDKQSAVATVLYGLAGAANNGRDYLQVLSEATDHVGAVLIGPSAERFEFLSEHRGATPRELKLVGADGKPGLVGGEKPESEPLIVRFLGADKPGEYPATIRIVTQAGNAGALSFAQSGEPPVNLYYVDIPIRVQVK